MDELVMTAEPTADVQDTPETEQGFTLKVCGKTMEVSREQAIALAQKGADYDRVKADAEDLRRWKQENEGRLSAAKKREEEDFESFLTRFPQVSPQDIPEEVWRSVSEGESLVSAWLGHENRRLQELLSSEKNRREAENETTGSLRSDGANPAGDWMLSGW